jgi:uroporphyrinogen decarboxylase
MMTDLMTRRERLEAAMAGAAVDRPPVALWRHWPGDDRTPQGLADNTVRFQRQFDFDFVKVTPTSSFCLQDWGAQDEWRGNLEGTRDYTVRPIQDPVDWTNLAVLDPEEGALGDQLECLRLIQSELGETVPVIQTIFNPLAQAKNLAGNERLLLHLRQFPDAVHEGLETITETTIHFVEAAQATGVAGIFYAVQHARYGLLSEAEYRSFGRAYDLRILDVAQSSWLNVLHLHGVGVMFDLVAEYPVGVLNWHDRETGISLKDGLQRFSGAVCGGLARHTTIMRGARDEVSAEAQDALAQTGGHRFVLGTGCVVPVVAPWGNVAAVRSAVERVEKEG